MANITNFEQRQLLKHWKKQYIKFKVLGSDVDSIGKPFVKVIPYISSMETTAFLDNAFSPDRWKNKLGSDGVLRGLSIKIGDSFITKYNTSPIIGDELPGAKEWGIGRYLHDIEPILAECSFEKKEGYNKTCSTYTRRKIYWKYPVLPKEYQEHELVSKKDLEVIIDLVKKIDRDSKEYLEHLGVNSLSQLYDHEAEEVISTLEKILKKIEGS